MNRKTFLLLAAISVMMATSLTSYSDKTEVIDNTANVLGGNLIGNWYGEYSADETAADGTYTKTVEGLQFNADGTGTYTQVVCNVASEPLSIYGGTMDKTNGRFHYTSKADGTVVITRDGEGDKTHPKTWTMTLADSVLCGQEGTASFQLKTAEDYQLSFLSQWEEALRSGSNSDKNTRSFLTDWFNCEKVYISGMKDPQYLPWAPANPAKSDIPEYLLEEDELTPDYGWEMAFCALSTPGADRTRYFGLYNRYRGILRIYMYIPDAKSYGKEMAFEISSGKNGKNRFPLFHSMDYGIPSDRPYREWDNTVLLSTGSSRYSAFSWTQTPYTEKVEANGVSSYWHCFDIDMSAYTPDIKETPWRTQVESNQELLSLKPISQNVSQIKLTGSLIGNLKGDFTSENEVMSAPCSKHTHRAGIYANLIGGILSKVPGLGAAALGINSNTQGIAGWEGAGENAFALGCAGTLFSSAGMICQIFNPQKKTMEKSGSMDLKINANLDLSGVMSSWKSLSDGGLRITPAILDQTNPKSSIGKGCVGLVTAPVIYVSEEDFLSETENVKLVYTAGAYEASGVKENLRFVTFLDPNSVKININKDIYTNIKDVHVTAYCGIDAKSPSGNTDSYREAMKMSPRPTIKLYDGTKSTINLNTSTSAVKLQTINKDTLLKDDPVSYPTEKDINEQIVSLAKPKMVTQVGDDIYRYYGSSLDLLGAHWVLEPQCYLPYNGNIYKAPVVPDLLVTVVIEFKSKQLENVRFVKQYVPEFKTIKHADLKAKRDELQKYYDTSKAGKAVGKVANDASIDIYDSYGYQYVQKNLKMLNAIADKTY